MENSAENDLDIEAKFFIKMPYDSDDPDFNWHKTFTSTDDDDEVFAKKGYDKIAFKEDGQKSRRYRKISQNNNATNLLRRQSNNNETIVSPQFKSTPKQFNYSRVYRGFQLIGDSQLLRFSEQLLQICVPTTSSGESRRLGYCISGQKIREIEQRLISKDYPIGKKIIMLIGTNDFLYNTSFDNMCSTYKSIVSFLKENVQHIILLTVPPVPKLAGRAEYWIKLKRFNDFILTNMDERRVYVFDLASLYITYNNTVSLEYFEETYFSSSSRPDLIHLNNIGFRLLKSILDIYLDKNKLV
ncbi:hypothetical protein RN001_003018 [Aquatica leii]|uniref:OSK domain-containing protein n=1 Tax=Aquatica leii TaxID=1421715 RepID=A0AAN7Q952_9COLE|nr:hypothetical protein RN001_003018 [Aquatica leii]